MARAHARIKTSIWSNKEFVGLTAGAQRTYHLVLEQPTLSMCGVVALTVARWASMASDTPQRVIRATLRELTVQRFVYVDDASEEVWVRAFAKHDINFKIPNTVVAMSNDFCAIRSEPIRLGFLESLPDTFLDQFGEGLAEGLMERLAEGFREALTQQLLTRTCASVPPSPSPSPSPPAFTIAKGS